MGESKRHQGHQQPRRGAQLREGPHVPVMQPGQLKSLSPCQGCKLGAQSLCGRAGKEYVENLQSWWESLTSCTQEGEENRAKLQIKPESFTDKCCWCGVNVPG